MMLPFGTKDDVPEDILEALGREKRDGIIYWSRADSSQPIYRHECCFLALIFGLLPCAWPTMCVVSPVIVCGSFMEARKHKNAVCVVTSEAVEYLYLPHDNCCIHGCCSASLTKKIVSFESIRDVEIHYHDTGCLCTCLADLNRVTIMDGTFARRKKHAAKHVGTTFLGHTNLEVFKAQVMNAKTLHSPHPQGGAAGVQQMVMTELMTNNNNVSPVKVVPLNINSNNGDST